jgi:hypothetical protein
MAEVEPSDDPELPVHTDEPMAFQSRQMLMIAKLAGLLTYRYPVDMNEEAQVATLLEDLRASGDADFDLPTDNGVYYFVYIDSETGRFPMLIREGEVRGYVLGVAAKAGREAAWKLRYYHGALPA